MSHLSSAIKFQVMMSLSDYVHDLRVAIRTKCHLTQMTQTTHTAIEYFDAKVLPLF